VEGIGKMCNYYAYNGITSVLATTMTDGKENSYQAMSNIKDYCNQEKSGSRILGINLEGPFLGKDKKGAHDERYLLEIDIEFFEKLDELSGKQIRIVSIDPNLTGAMEFIRDYKDEKVISLAHTSASYETAISAMKAGANHVTHLFNAMNPLHHREPGLLGAALEKPCFTEIICDGIHIHPAIIRFLFQSIPGKVVLISDSMMAAGLSDGNYLLGGLNVTVQNGKATLEDGTIAGSATNLYHSMCNAIKFGVKPEDAILSATYLPAKSIGKEGVAGSIGIGRKADLLILHKDYSIKTVLINGKQVR
jgi:N-acetylglucosamine-6-phosphate deacetylase